MQVVLAHISSLNFNDDQDEIEINLVEREGKPNQIKSNLRMFKKGPWDLAGCHLLESLLIRDLRDVGMEKDSIGIERVNEAARRKCNAK